MAEQKIKGIGKEKGRTRRCRHWARGACNLGEKCGFAHSGEAGKTRPCRHFLRGFCKLGDRCDFAHTSPPLLQYGPPFYSSMLPFPSSNYYRPSLLPPPPIYPPFMGIRNPRPCRHWAKGYCRLGNSCGFGHFGAPGGATSIPKKKCWHWAKGMCSLGSRCGFLHPPTESSGEKEERSL